MIRASLLLYIASAVAPVLAVATESDTPYMSLDDRVRIAEAFRIADRYQERLWPGWSDAPRALLLITKEREFLVYHHNPSSDFSRVTYDSLLQSEVYTRERVFEPNLLATFPAVSGVPTIVIGQPKNTDASHSTRWILTVLHEHFHQWQQSQPDYYDATNGLDLASDDDSGMWMLNYKFPYERPDINTIFSEMCRALYDAIEAKSNYAAQKKARVYLGLKEELKRKIDPRDYVYLSFQLWQEGVARYTEFKMARLASATYRPSAAFAELDDATSLLENARRIREHVATRLLTVSLRKGRRTAFYSVGAAEAILLDRIGRDWRSLYFKQKFFMEKYYRLDRR